MCVCVCVGGGAIKNMATVQSFDNIPNECTVVGSCEVATENTAQKYIAELHNP